MISTLINVAIRGVTLAGRLVLVFLLARLLAPTDLGMFGLISATNAFAIYLFGFEFSSYSMRELLIGGRSRWGAMLKSQAALSLLFYLCFLPLFSLVFFQGLIPWKYAGWVFVLLVIEHLNQELSRLLVAMSEQLSASLVLFLRSSAWAIVMVGVMGLYPGARNLETVLDAWTLGAATALAFSGYRLYCLALSDWRSRIDWAWLGRGLKVAIPLLLATLSVRGVLTADRYWFEHLNDRDTLGAYVLFISLANALPALLDAGVFAYAYPALINANLANDEALFRRTLKRTIWQTLLPCTVFSAASLFAVAPFLRWLNRPTYVEHAELYPWLLLATVLYALSLVPHYGLYAKGRDKPIIRGHILGVISFIAGTWLCSRYSSELAVPVGLVLCFSTLLVFKSVSLIADFQRPPHSPCAP